ncbi:MAG: hypothetical protein IFK92_13135 [Acidobacteria bacterium]|nr:hypothetical protein [Candidatus Sulfomarinibacter kjeldsenii]
MNRRSAIVFALILVVAVIASAQQHPFMLLSWSRPWTSRPTRVAGIFGSQPPTAPVRTD